MSLYGIKPVTAISGSTGFCRKIMQKHKTGRKNISRFPTMIFFKKRGYFFPEKISMILNFRLYLNQQNIAPVLILRNIPVTGRIVSGLNSEKKSFQSIFKLKNVQTNDDVPKIFPTSFQIPQEYNVRSENNITSHITSHFLTENIPANKTPVFSLLKSLIFRAGNVANNLDKILNSVLPASGAFYQQKTLMISPDIFTGDSKILSYILSYENNLKIFNSCFGEKIWYRWLNTAISPTFVNKENALKFLTVFKNGLSLNYLGKQSTIPSSIPSLVVKNISVIKETWLKIEKNGMRSLVEPENASNRIDAANVSLAALRSPEVYQAESGILPAGKIFANKTPIFSSLKYFLFKAGKLVTNSNKMLKSSFFPAIDNEYMLNHWPLFGDKSPLNQSGNKNATPFFIPFLVVKNIYVIKEILSRLNTEKNCLKLIARQKDAMNVDYTSNMYVSQVAFKTPQGFYEGSDFLLTENAFSDRFLTENIATKKISVFSLLRPFIFRAGNITDNSHKILKSSFLPVNHDFESQKPRAIFPDILSFNQKTGRVRELLLNSEKLSVLTVIDRYFDKFHPFDRFHPFRFSTAHTHHDPFLKYLVFKDGNKISNSNRILKPQLRSENSIYHQQIAKSSYSGAVEVNFQLLVSSHILVSSQVLNSKINEIILNSQVFRANKNYEPLNITRHPPFYNKKSILKNQPFFKGKSLAVFLQDNSLFNKKPGVNIRFIKESNRAASNEPLIKNNYGSSGHGTSGYVQSGHNYKMRPDSLVFQEQGYIEQEIEQIKRTILETKKSVSEKTVPVFGEAEIKKYLDINRISSQVYQNLERTIRMERESRGM